MKTYLRIFLATTAICRIQAQSSPQELANTVLQRWTEDSATAFASQFPFREGQEIHSNAAKAKLERTKGLSSVIHADQKTAALLLSGVPLTGNSGDDTIYGMGFSAIYEALADGERWRLARQIPLDETGQITAQQLKVSLRPGPVWMSRTVCACASKAPMVSPRASITGPTCDWSAREVRRFVTSLAVVYSGSIFPREKPS